MTLPETGLETLTSGRTKRLEKYIDDELLMVTYGDLVADIGIKALLEYHKQHGNGGSSVFLLRYS